MMELDQSGRGRGDKKCRVLTARQFNSSIQTGFLLHAATWPGLRIMVAGGRIELPTRGFSVRCSTN